VTGVTVRLGNAYSSLTQSQLLDTTPGTSGFSDAPLGVGRSVTDPTSNVTFTTVSLSSTGATVGVAYGADTQKPTMAGNLQANATTATAVTLSWTASSDNIGVAGYRVYRGGGATPVTTTTSTSYTDTGRSPSTTYSYSVVAFDAQNNVSDPATASATTPAVDVTPPSVPGTLSYLKLSGGKAKLTWGAATDNIGVAGYRVYRNGALRATVGAGTFTYTDRLHEGRDHLLRGCLRHVEQRGAGIQHGHRQLRHPDHVTDRGFPSPSPVLQTVPIP
jgi:chitodextrinase